MYGYGLYVLAQFGNDISIKIAWQELHAKRVATYYIHFFFALFLLILSTYNSMITEIIISVNSCKIH